jgi:hypothetical protein
MIPSCKGYQSFKEILLFKSLPIHMVEIVVASDMEYMVFSILLHILIEKKGRIKNRFNPFIPASKTEKKNF